MNATPITSPNAEEEYMEQLRILIHDAAVIVHEEGSKQRAYAVLHAVQAALDDFAGEASNADIVIALGTLLQGHITEADNAC